MKKFATAFHLSLGLAGLCIYPYYLYNMESILPKMAETLTRPGYTVGRYRMGFYLFLSLPMVSVCCFLFPNWLMRKFSPRTDLLKEPLLTPGFWYFIGDVLILLFIVGCMAFL